MNNRARHLLHLMDEVKHNISLWQGYLEYLEKEFKKEVNGEVEK